VYFCLVWNFTVEMGLVSKAELLSEFNEEMEKFYHFVLTGPAREVILTHYVSCVYLSLSS